MIRFDLHVPEADLADLRARLYATRWPERETVALKVLRPGIRSRFRSDLETMSFAARAIERLFPSARRLRLIDVAAFKELSGVSRKYAIPLLEYFDRERVTRRAGDRRLIL